MNKNVIFGGHFENGGHFETQYYEYILINSFIQALDIKTIHFDSEISPKSEILAK